jgi:hypothetical protein
MSCRDIANWLGVLGTALQLIGGVMTLWGLLSATDGAWPRIKALVGALWRSQESRAAAELSVLNADKRVRALQGLALLSLGYLLALLSQLWLIVLG